MSKNRKTSTSLLGIIGITLLISSRTSPLEAGPLLYAIFIIGITTQLWLISRMVR